MRRYRKALFQISLFLLVPLLLLPLAHLLLYLCPGRVLEDALPPQDTLISSGVEKGHNQKFTTTFCRTEKDPMACRPAGHLLQIQIFAWSWSQKANLWDYSPLTKNRWITLRGEVIQRAFAPSWGLRSRRLLRLRLCSVPCHHSSNLFSFSYWILWALISHIICHLPPSVLPPKSHEMAPGRLSACHDGSNIIFQDCRPKSFLYSVSNETSICLL